MTFLFFVACRVGRVDLGGPATLNCFVEAVNSFDCLFVSHPSELRASSRRRVEGVCREDRGKVQEQGPGVNGYFFLICLFSKALKQRGTDCKVTYQICVLQKEMGSSLIFDDLWPREGTRTARIATEWLAANALRRKSEMRTTER